MEAARVAKEVEGATGLHMFEVYEERYESDGGFNWEINGHRYHVQIASYEPEPYLIHKSLDDGCIQIIKACHDVTELITHIREIVNNGGE